MLAINPLIAAIPSITTPAPKPEKIEARVVEKYYRDANEYDVVAVYTLDNGVHFSIPFYKDIHLSIGENISWVKEAQGIRLFYRDQSVYLMETVKDAWYILPWGPGV